MHSDDLYELVTEAVRQSLAEERGGADMRIARRMSGGKVIFEDDQGRQFKEMDAHSFFRKVTAVREKLRVLEQKINNHDALSHEDRAELQAYITRCYGSLTSFNVLFADEGDKFKGTGG